MLSWFRRHSRKAPIVICAVCTAAVVFQYFAEDKIDDIVVPRVEFILSHLRSFKPLRGGEYYTEDAIATYLGRKAKRSPELVYLAIDNYSVQFNEDDIRGRDPSPVYGLMMQGGWPWPRTVYPYIYDRLFGAGAKVVALDLMFPTEREGDDAFRAALDKYHDRVLVGSNFVTGGEMGAKFDYLQLPTPDLLPNGSPTDDRIGYVNYWPDTDGVNRRVNYHVVQSLIYREVGSPDEEVYHSFDTMVLKKSGHAASVPDGMDRHRIRFAGPQGTFIPYSLRDIFDSYNWHERFQDGAFFKDKIVLIGPDGNFLKDVVRTPFGDMPGPELHLNAINAALTGEFLRKTPDAVNYALIVVSGLISLLLSMRFPKPLTRLSMLVLVGGTWLVIAQLAYNFGSLIILTFVPATAFWSSGVLCLAWDFFMEQRDKARLRGKFERYMSKHVVKEIVDNPESYFNTKGGMRKPVAIFFSDLRGFTSMTEKMADEHALVAQLNEYFDVMVGPIHDTDGCLDKLIGDAIMAVWGNIQSRGPEEDVAAAVASALKMRELLPVLNAKWEGEGKGQYAMGMGINFGTVIVGDLGSKQQMNFTVIGDAVNLASRIEGTTKDYHVDLLVGEDAAKLVKDKFLMQSAGLTQVKGRMKPVELFYVISKMPEKIEPWQQEYLRLYAEGIALYLKGNFTEALDRFNRSLVIHPPDALAKVYIERCTDMAKNPVPEGWNGVYVKTGK